MEMSVNNMKTYQKIYMVKPEGVTIIQVQLTKFFESPPPKVVWFSIGAACSPAYFTLLLI